MANQNITVTQPVVDITVSSPVVNVTTGLQGPPGLSGTSDGKSSISANDTDTGYLNGKLIAGTGITLTENNDGGSETLTITSSGGGVSDHGTLTGLADDDHTQYLLADGTRDVTGSLNATVELSAPRIKLTGGIGTQGNVSWNTDEETIDVVVNGTSLHVGQEMHIHARNNNGVTLYKGTPVMATGTLGASGRIIFAKMDGTDPANAKFFLGVLTEDIINDSDGKLTTFGKIRQIDTSGTPYGETWVDGDVIWVDTTTVGDLTKVEPSSGLALPIAIVISSHATTGTLFVRATSLDLNAYATVTQGTDSDNHIANTSNPHSVTKSQVLTGDLIVDADVDSGAAIDSSKIAVDTIGTPSVSDLSDLHNVFLSAGWMSGGAVSDAGANTINVTAGEGAIRTTNSYIGNIKVIDWAASNGLSIPAETTRWIGVEYNAGSPQVTVRTTEDFDNRTDFVLALVTNEGGTIYVATAPQQVGDAVNVMVERIHETMGIRRNNELGGLILGESGTRNVTMSAGELWNRLNVGSPIAIDTSVSGSFNRYYSDGGSGFTKESAQTQWNNTQYDNGTGALETLGTNKYANQWFYSTVGGALLCMYGTVEHNSLGAASAENPPSSLPVRVKDMATLIGRMIIKKGDTSTTQIDSAFDTSFGGTVVTDHVNLSNTGNNTHTQIDAHIADSDIHTPLAKAGSAPSSPSEGDMWLNTTTQVLSIYTNSVWESITYKSELSADAGNLTLNAGYF